MFYTNLYYQTSTAGVLECVVSRNVNGGYYGDLLAGHECIVGRYPVTESLLKLVSAIVSQVCAGFVQILEKSGKSWNLK